MAQIIKHRRGVLTQLKDVTARIGEIVMATGSIGDLNGPLVFVGETEGVGGAYRAVSKIYQGTTAPTLTVGSHGSVIDGTPFYASSNKSLYVLSKDGNDRLDLTGNIEGNTIASVTISGLTGTTATIENVSGSFTGSGQGLYNIPASGITGLQLNRISEGSVTASISEADGLRVNTKTEITGALIVTGDITGSNLQLSGDANINGNIFLGGNITVGDSDTDFVKFDAEISSSIVPDVHNAFDLGSSLKNWRNLHVSGTAYVDTLVAEQVNFSDLSILQDLTVSGSTFLGNGGDITIISGSVFNDQLTNNRVVIVGTQGLLEDDANFTFDGTKLTVGTAEIDQSSGDIRTSGSLLVTSTSELKGSVGINSTLTVTGDTQLMNLYVSGNLKVLGSATSVFIQSQTVELDDNIIKLNAYSPFQRYAGFEVMDSGSTNLSASLLWDGLNDYWMFMSSSGQSSKLIGTTAGTYGSEISLTTNRITKATGTSTIGDSLLSDDATTLAYNTNKFTVDATNGATLIAGNVTLTSAGGSDAGNNTTSIVFKNSSNILGYVSTTETTDVLDGILGYKSSDGALVFSTVIDGGSY
jgi:hypothetical protein